MAVHDDVGIEVLASLPAVLPVAGEHKIVAVRFVKEGIAPRILDHLYGTVGASPAIFQSGWRLGQCVQPFLIGGITSAIKMKGVEQASKGHHL